MYTPKDLAGPRPLSLSRADLSFTEKPNTAARVSVAIVGVCVVLGTAIAVVLGTSEDEPKTPAEASSAAAEGPSPGSTSMPVETVPPPAPVVVGDPVDPSLLVAPARDARPLVPPSTSNGSTATDLAGAKSKATAPKSKAPSRLPQTLSHQPNPYDDPPKKK